jgi:hypothetical protein
MREKLLPTQCIKAIQEELAGFLLREVLREKGEHYVEDEECYFSIWMSIFSTVELNWSAILNQHRN